MSASRQETEDSAANSTLNKQNTGLRLMTTHKACLNSVNSLLLPVTAIAAVTAPNPPSLAGPGSGSIGAAYLGSRKECQL